jgi:hypothetical protein
MMPRWLFARPARNRMCSTSPLPGAGRDQRVVAELAGVAVARAVLLLAVNLLDERVNIDRQAPLAGASAGPPRPAEQLPEDPVELANMPERERPQKCPQRRGRHHAMAEDPDGAPAAQHVTPIDAVCAQEHRVHQRHDFASRPEVPRASPEINAPVDERLNSQPLTERRSDQNPGVRDRPIVVENHDDLVQRMLHHVGDLLSGAAAA